MKLYILLGLIFNYHSLAFAKCSSLNPGSVNKKIATELSVLARKNITRAYLRDGSFVKEESEDEKKLPIVSKEWESCAVAAGFASASAEFCGLNYNEKIFKPFMELFRQKSNATDKQSAYVGLLHGIALGVASEQFKKSNATCSDKMKASLEKLEVK